MKQQRIYIAKGIEFPIDVATQKTAFIGRSSSGKSYGASKLAEELLDAGVQVVILDPVGIWHGLRTLADGRGKGFPIPVFGGEYGDIPLLPSSGALVANVIIEKGISAVLDVSYMRKGERKEFVTAFAEQFFHLKKKNRSAVHLIVEEAQVFIPQRTMHGEERMLGAMEDICKLGRNYGIGITLISQRPQSIHKDCLNQTEALFAFQINGAHERKAIEDWIVDKGLSKSTVGEDLSGLHVGECFLWSPQWLRILEKIKILPKKTFDASSTPKVGANIGKARQLAPIDLKKIKIDMESVINTKKENDPTELKKIIFELRKQLGKQVPIQIPVKNNLEVNNLKAELIQAKKQIKEHEIRFRKISDYAKDIDDRSRKSLNLIMQETHYGVPYSIGGTEIAKAVTKSYIVNHPKTSPSIISSNPQKQIRRMVDMEPNNASLGKCERNILIALAQRGKTSTKNQVGILSGYTITSGSFNNSLSKLRTSQYIEGGANAIVITSNGLDALGQYDPLPQGEELRKYWLSTLGKAESSILNVLMNSYPNELTKDEIADQCGYMVTSGSFNNSLSKLRTLELAEGKKEIKASDSLFE